MNENKKTPKYIREIILVLIGAIIGVILAYAIVASGLKRTGTKVESKHEQNSTTADDKKEGNKEDKNKKEDKIDFITTYKYKHEEVSDSKLKNIQKDMQERIDRIRRNNSLVQLQTGKKEFETYVYNNNGECVAETSDGSYSVVFRNDNKVVKYENSSGALAVGNDIDILQFIENAVLAVGKVDSAKMYYYPIHSDDKNDKFDYDEYRVDLKDEAAIRLCYSPLGEKFADVMIDSLKSQDKKWKPHLVVVLYIPKDKNNQNFGAVALSVYDNLSKEFTNWDLLGWIQLENWKLDNWWYTYDFSKANTKDYVSHMKSLMDNLHKMLDKANSEDKAHKSGVKEKDKNAEGTTKNADNANSK